MRSIRKNRIIWGAQKLVPLILCAATFDQHFIYT